MKTVITGQSSNAINFQETHNTTSRTRDNGENAPSQADSRPKGSAYSQNQSSKNAFSLRKKFMSSEAYRSEQTKKLMQEAKKGNMERVQQYLAKGADLTKAVHTAINDGATLEGLLAAGGDPNCLYNGLTPADRADHEKNALSLAVLLSDPRFDPTKIVDPHLRTIMQASVWAQSRANSNLPMPSNWHDPDSIDPLDIPGR